MSTNAETAGGGSEVTQRRRVVDDGRAAREFGWRPEVPIARRLTRRWFRARGLVLGLPLAAARARGPVLVEEAPEPVVCRHGPECDAKWRRAREWVGMHSRWPIREDTDALIDDRRRAPPPSAGIWHHAASESGKLTSIEHCVHLVHER